MQLKKKRERFDEIPSSSLPDIAFLLIIFFMVTSAFILREGLVTILPKATSDPVKVAREDLLKIIIEPEQKLQVNDRPYTLSELKSACTAEGIRTDMVSMIRIDPEVPYKDVVYVVGELQSLGLNKFSIKKRDGND